MIRLACFFFALLIAAPALATPPRMTMSEDRLMAATQTHLYVLRDITDNLGSHFAGLHDQHLIEIDIESGAATRFWPLRIMAINHLPANDLMVPGIVTERPGATHDMTAILRGVAAEPMTPQVWQDSDIALQSGALVRAGSESLATPFAMRAAGRAQLGILRQAYPVIETEEVYRSGAQIDFYDLYQPGDWDCTLRPDRYTIYRAADRVTVLKLTCEDMDLTGIWSFHVIVIDDL